MTWQNTARRPHAEPTTLERSLSRRGNGDLRDGAVEIGSAERRRDSLVQELAARLREVAPLTGVSASCRAALAEIARPCSFSKGEPIQAEGTVTSSFYLLLSGRIKMFRSLPSGRDVVPALFGPGEIFGTVAALGGQACDASLVALEETRCLEIERGELFALFERQPSLVGELLPVLTRELVECKNCLVELTCYRVEMRFAQLLLKFSRSVGQPREDGTFIPIALSRQELADMTGTTIETCIRIMSRWSKQGVVETHKEGFLIRDRTSLEQLVDA